MPSSMGRLLPLMACLPPGQRRPGRYFKSSSFAESCAAAATGPVNAAAVAAAESCSPHSPVGQVLARTSSGLLPAGAFSRQNSGGLPEAYGGQGCSPVGSSMAGAFNGGNSSSGGAARESVVSPLGSSSSVPLSFGSSYSLSRQWQGLQDGVSAGGRRAPAGMPASWRRTSSTALPGVHGLNDKHPITERWVGRRAAGVGTPHALPAPLVVWVVAAVREVDVGTCTRCSVSCGNVVGVGRAAADVCRVVAHLLFAGGSLGFCR